MLPSLKAGFSLSSSQRSIISNTDGASSESKRAFKQSVSNLNGSARNIICGFFICRSRNRDTKLSFRVSKRVAYLGLCLFRVAAYPLAFSRVGKCVKSPLLICFLNSFSLLTKADSLCSRPGSNFNLPCKFRFNLLKVTQHVDQKS